jgi:flavin-dependent dehydrogenase
MQPWSVQEMQGRAGDWCCDLVNVQSGVTTRLTAAVAIDAHGSWEALPSARRAGHRAYKASDLLAFKANFRQTRLQPGLLSVLSFVGGYGGMVEGADGVTTVACCIRRDRLAAYRDAAPGMSAGEVVEDMLKAQCGGVRIALQGATRIGSWMAAGPIMPGVFLDQAEGVFRVGNAAGEAHPIVGEGISMALQSPWLLCKHLLSRGRRSELADQAWQHEVGRRYARDWKSHFLPRFRLAAAFAHMAMRPTSAAALLGLVQRWPGLLSMGALWSGKARCAASPELIAALSEPPELEGHATAMNAFELRQQASNPRTTDD